MGNKQVKIKRYKNIYGHNRGNGRAIKIILIIAAVVLCCFVGWAMYEPVYNWFVGDENEDISSSEADVSSKESKPLESEAPKKEEKKEESKAPLKEDKKETENSKETASKENEVSVAPAENKNDGGVFLPHAILNDKAQLDSFLKDLKAKGCTSVVVDAKNAIGEVLFLSENETAISSLAIVGDAFDAKSVASSIKSAGLVPVAKIHAFRDGLAAMAHNDLACKYYDTSYIWLDNSAELGGRGWLNPYSSEAAEYIGSLAAELINAGFKEIIVDSAHYPLGVGREKIGFGEVTADKLSALTSSMEKIEDMVTSKGGRVSFVLNPRDYENDLDMVYGGDVLKNKEYSYALTASVDKLDSIEATLDKINSMGKDADVILLSYTYDGSSATKEKLKLILNQLKSKNIGSIYLYNPEGIY